MLFLVLHYQQSLYDLFSIRVSISTLQNALVQKFFLIFHVAGKIYIFDSLVKCLRFYHYFTIYHRYDRNNTVQQRIIPFLSAVITRYSSTNNYHRLDLYFRREDLLKHLPLSHWKLFLQRHLIDPLSIIIIGSHRSW